MGRPKINKSDKKIKISITLSKEAMNILINVTNNKSKMIEGLIINYYNNGK
jgi:hypothetical protein